MPVNINRQAGFNLVEVLITLLVLSIGLLGVSSMLFNSVRFSDTAAQQSQAVYLAYDIVDKLRTNSENPSDYAIAFSATIPSPPDCSSATCNSTNMAQADLDDWKTMLAANLPQGDGRIVVNATQATVTVQWTDRGLPARSYTLNMAL